MSYGIFVSMPDGNVMLYSESYSGSSKHFNFGLTLSCPGQVLPGYYDMKAKQMHIGATICATLAAIAALQDDFTMMAAVSALILAGVAVAFLVAAERLAHSTDHHVD